MKKIPEDIRISSFLFNTGKLVAEIEIEVDFR